MKSVHFCPLARYSTRCNTFFLVHLLESFNIKQSRGHSSNEYAPVQKCCSLVILSQWCRVEKCKHTLLFCCAWSTVRLVYMFDSLLRMSWRDLRSLLSSRAAWKTMSSIFRPTFSASSLNLSVPVLISEGKKHKGKREWWMTHWLLHCVLMHLASIKGAMVGWCCAGGEVGTTEGPFCVEFTHSVSISVGWKCLNNG